MWRAQVLTVKIENEIDYGKTIRMSHILHLIQFLSPFEAATTPPTRCPHILNSVF